MIIKKINKISDIEAVVRIILIDDQIKFIEDYYKKLD